MTTDAPELPAAERFEEIDAEAEVTNGPWKKVQVVFQQAPYTITLLLMLTSLMTLSFLGTSPWGNLIAISTSIASFVVVRAAGHHQQDFDWGKYLIIILVVLLPFVILVQPQSRWQLLSAGTFLVVTELGAILLTASALVRSKTMGMQPMFGALSIYLMLGLMFSGFFMLLTAGSDKPVLNNAGEMHIPDYVYFTFITMMSVGYGDITPMTEPARMLAVITGLGGQIYLVTVVSAIVAMVTSQRKTSL